MTTNVTDVRSNSKEQIVHAAETIGRSKDRRKVFEAIYKGKKRAKNVEEIMNATGLSQIRVLQCAGELASDEVVKKIDTRPKSYEQYSFFQKHKNKILSIAGKEDKISQIPTKRNPLKIKNIVRKLPPSKMFKVKQITIEDIDNFSKIKKIKSTIKVQPILETPFKEGIQAIIGEAGKFKDWGGEKNDLYSTRLRVNGKRIPGAFAFKGKGKTGKLVPGKMGKNGDQIQRLFESSAKIFIVQYWGIIDESVIEQMYRLAISKSVTENREIFFGVIDGEDTQRIINAYENNFPTLK